MNTRICVIDQKRELPEHREQVCVPCENFEGRQLDELGRMWPLLLQRANPSVDPAQPWVTVPALQFDAETLEGRLVPRRLLAADAVPAGNQ